MTNIEKNIEFKKKVIIFDLDGVLIDSKSNMRKSWKAVQLKFDLNNIKFNDYFIKIGFPFNDILEQLSIYSNYKNIKKCYDFTSIQNLNSIKFYSGIKKELIKLNLMNFILCIVTSKDIKRTNLILKEVKELFTLVQCPKHSLRGKPNPDQINHVIKKLNAKKNECVYIGDTHVDYLSARNANIDFIFANWGYGENKNYNSSINKISELYSVIKI